MKFQVEESFFYQLKDASSISHCGRQYKWYNDTN